MTMSNSELRRRKTREHNNEKTAPIRKRGSKDTATPPIFKSLLCLILSGSLLTVFFVFCMDDIPWHLGHRAVDSVAKKFGYHKPVHAVVIDAGSTGSRVLAFTFHESYIGGNLVLDKELFKYTKPGLSSFAKNPQKGVDTIAYLLEEAKREIPEKYWSKTPLILKATAGLRLLPPQEAENLLNSVRELFKETPFLTTDESVEIMDGTDEGIFSWFTVNFLLEKINGNPERTVAALDLGGGSTQVTYAAMTPASLKQKDFIHHANSPNGPIPVYTQSFLGLGLMAARKEILTLKPSETNNTNSVISECVNPIIKNKKFTFGGVDYFVSGLQKDYPTSKKVGNAMSEGEVIPIVNFDKCSDIVVDYVLKKATPPEELPLKHVFAFSYYFDRAIESGLVDESTGGKIQVKQFLDAAQNACHEANAEQPFMCLDLTFIWALLEKGFGLGGNKDIYLYKKIDGHEISWALGAAFDVLRG